MNKLNRRLVLLALPFFAGFLLFYLIPLIGSLRYSFVESAFVGRFVGLKNYIDALSNRNFALGVKNTLILIALGVPLLVAFALCLALLIKEASGKLTALRAAVVMPMLLPSAAVASAFSKLPLYDPRAPLIAIYVWKNAGFLMLILLAGLSMIPNEVYEAAHLDGAGRARAFMCVTLPLLSGALLFAFILAVAYNLRLFREAHLMYGSYPDARAYLTQHYINNHFYKLNYQKLTTASALFSAALFASLAAGVYLAGRHGREREG